MKKKYKVKLMSNQRKQLLKITHTGNQKVKTVIHAQVLLQADSGKGGPALKAKKIALNLNIHERTVHRIRERFANEGLEAAIYRKKHCRYKPKIINGEQEAHLIALCCSSPPEGYKSWTITLLNEKLIELKIVNTISRSTVHRTLKKMNLNLG